MMSPIIYKNLQVYDLQVYLTHHFLADGHP